jgi:hypothetical protein
MEDAPSLAGIRAICKGATFMSEGADQYIYLPGLKLPNGRAVDALLRPQPREGDGYMTRLFLAESVPDKGANWTIHHILDRDWHTWSWNGVEATGEYAEILLNHLRALR